MAKIVTLDQTVPALTTDLGASSPAENLALKNAMTAAGITTTTPAVVGASTNIPAGLVLNGTSMAPTVLATITMPATGYIAISATSGVAPISTTPITQPIIGGYVVGIKVGSNLVAQAMFVGNQAPNGTHSGLPLGGTTGHSYLAVTAGDVVTVVGTIFMTNAPGNYETVNPAGFPDADSVSYHYL